MSDPADDPLVKVSEGNLKKGKYTTQLMPSTVALCTLARAIRIYSKCE